MSTDDIIALAILTVAGVTGYLLYTKQIELPKDIPNPFESKDDDKDEEKKIVRGLENETPSESESESRDSFDVKKFMDDAFERGKTLTKPKPFDAKNIINDALERGKKLVSSSPKSLDDLINDAFKGNPFKPYSGTKYRPYD